MSRKRIMVAVDFFLNCLMEMKLVSALVPLVSMTFIDWKQKMAKGA